MNLTEDFNPRTKLMFIVFLCFAAGFFLWQLLIRPIFNDPEPQTQVLPEWMDSDGRYHPCGVVTEDGVTEYIAVYIERCGDIDHTYDAFKEG
jgi:hypothetical protein